MWSKLKEKKGSGMVEFVMIFGFLLLFLFTMMDIAFWFQQRYEINDAVNDALQYGTTKTVTTDQATCASSTTDRTSCLRLDVQKITEEYIAQTFLSGNVTSRTVTVTMPNSFKRGERMQVDVVVSSKSVVFKYPITFTIRQAEIIQQDPTS